MAGYTATLSNARGKNARIIDLEIPKGTIISKLTATSREDLTNEEVKCQKNGWSLSPFWEEIVVKGVIYYNREIYKGKAPKCPEGYKRIALTKAMANVR